MPEVAHGVVRGQELPVEGAVVALCLGQMTAKETEGLPTSCHELLQHRTDAQVGGVTGQPERCAWVWEVQLRGVGDGLLDGGERCDTFRRPVPWNCRRSQPCQWAQDGGGVLREGPVVIADTKEAEKLSSVGWFLEVSNDS